MKLNIYLDQKELLLVLLPLNIPDELKRLVLSYSGHLTVGHKSISWVLYF